MVPSSCQGVVFAPGNGKCQEMLSFRIVGAAGASACRIPARSHSRPIASRTVGGSTRRTATRLFIRSFYLVRLAPPHHGPPEPLDPFFDLLVARVAEVEPHRVVAA